MAHLPPSSAPLARPSVSVDPRRMLLAQWPDLRRTVRTIGRTHRLADDEIGDLLGDVAVRLMHDDFAVLRKFRGHSGLATYLHTVAYRVLLDRRIRQWGKWRPSRRARALGPVAVRFEQLVGRDGFSAAEARTLLGPVGGAGLDDTQADHLAARVRRPRRPRLLGLDLAMEVPVAPPQHQAFEAPGVPGQVSRVCAAMRHAVANLSAADAAFLRERFVHGHSIADVARRTGADQKQLYRRYARILRGLRGDLERGQVTAAEVRPLIGHAAAEISGVLAPAGH